MFYQLFERSHALTRHLAGPLFDERCRYLSHLAEQEMSRSTLRLTAELLIATEKYLKLASRPGESIHRQEIAEAAARWSIRKSVRTVQPNPKLSGQRFTHTATAWLTFLNRLHIPAPSVKAYNDMLMDFADFMRKERGLSPNTIEQRRHTASEFLDRLFSQDRSLKALTTSVVDSILAQKVNEEHYARKTVQTYASSLRSFFRYAEMRDWCPVGIAGSIMAPRAFQHESLPSAPAWGDVQKIDPASARFLVMV